MLFGAHCSGGIKKALDNATAMGAEAVQLFVQSPRTWRFPNHDESDLEAFRAKREAAGLPALVHSLYLVNLAAPDDAIYEKSVETMQATVDAACAIEAEAVIFHVGSHLGAGFETGLERVVPALQQVLDRCNERTWLLMENSAGAGGTIGRSIDELAMIFDALGGHERLGLCLDSCHLFVSGVDVTDAATWNAVLDDIDQRIGLDRLRALHANDAKAPLGSNRDRHDNIGDGLIGDGLGVFLAHPRLQGLPVILEVPGADGKGPNADELRKLRELHARAAV
ncbi:MAG: deoxyribonuclease [Gaiellaceae bacterium]|nr:deoxyribonuclease [Gaiellaceae bacterium]MDX6386540.1 deoxyribonuclease [Gaiellaceae bacterium]MDX6436653.1 deoxyribonuclease [Gaiellaceae bacterium]